MTAATTPASGSTSSSTDQFIQGIGPAAAISLVPAVTPDVWLPLGSETMPGGPIELGLSHQRVVAMKNLPLALGFGTALVSVLYILANFSYLNVLPFAGSAEGATVLAQGIQHASQDRVGTAALEVMFGSAGATLMAIALLLVVLLVDPDQRKFSAFGLMIVALGLPVYFLWHRRGQGGA